MAIVAANTHLQNNAALRKQRGDGGVTDAHRDQGLARPKVLILTPMRNSAAELVQAMRTLLFGGGARGKAAPVVNAHRFDDEFNVPAEQKDSMRADRAEDYKHTFRGNIDDCFRVGIGTWARYRDGRQGNRDQRAVRDSAGRRG